MIVKGPSEVINSCECDKLSLSAWCPTRGQGLRSCRSNNVDGYDDELLAAKTGRASFQNDRGKERKKDERRKKLRRGERPQVYSGRQLVEAVPELAVSSRQLDGRGWVELCEGQSAK